jgi:hypothetical protein
MNKEKEHDRNVKRAKRKAQGLAQERKIATAGWGWGRGGE